MYDGLATDWPLSWAELEPFVGESRAKDRRGRGTQSAPGRQAVRALSDGADSVDLQPHRDEEVGGAGRDSFLRLPAGAQFPKPYDGRPECHRCNTCTCCPIGARYSPDYTFKQLLEKKKITLHDQTLIRSLVMHDTRPDIVAATGVNYEHPGDVAEYRARTFVIASGYTWTSWLLLLEARAIRGSRMASRRQLRSRWAIHDRAQVHYREH